MVMIINIALVLYIPTEKTSCTINTIQSNSQWIKRKTEKNETIFYWVCRFFPLLFVLSPLFSVKYAEDNITSSTIIKTSIN